MLRAARLALLLPLAAPLGCAALRLPAAVDPDRSRHAYELEGEVRREPGLTTVAGAELLVEGAGAVLGSRTTDATGRFWIRVEGVTRLAPDPSGSGAGPAGFVLLSARAGAACAPETKVVLPAAGPVVLVVRPCPPAPAEVRP
jgi:hypothetical protein